MQAITDIFRKITTPAQPITATKDDTTKSEDVTALNSDKGDNTEPALTEEMQIVKETVYGKSK